MNFLVIGFISILVIGFSPICYSYKVLVISPTPLISHIILNRVLVKTLLKAGYEVTHITVARNRKYHPNLKEIYIDPNSLSKINFGEPIEKQNATAKKDRDAYQKFIIKQFCRLLQHPSSSRLFWNTTQTFDLVIAEWLFSGIFSGLGALYECPLIWFATTEIHLLMFRLVDKNHVSPVIINEDFERRAFARIFEPLFAMRGKPLYSYDQLRSNAALVFINSHTHLDMEREIPKLFIQIGGLHIESKREPIQKNLKRIMDNAHQGFIYMSLGTIMDSLDLTKLIWEELVKMFGGLKQIVLWQQEKNVVNLPNNVHVLKWTPQQDILSHPNCVLFITHGGALSVIEALHFGVPMVGLPVYGDQFSNVDRAVRKGVAKKIDISEFMVDEIKNAILEITSKFSYRHKAKELSSVYRHQSIVAKNKLIYWVNHTILTNNFTYNNDTKSLYNTYSRFKTYIPKVTLNVGIITISALILIPFSFKLLVSLLKKPKTE